MEYLTINIINKYKKLNEINQNLANIEYDIHGKTKKIEKLAYIAISLMILILFTNIIKPIASIEIPQNFLIVISSLFFIIYLLQIINYIYLNKKRSKMIKDYEKEDNLITEFKHIERLYIQQEITNLEKKYPELKNIENEEITITI